MSPAWLLALTLYMYTSIHINFWCIYSLEQYLISDAFKSILNQYRCSLGPRNFPLPRGSERSPDLPAPLKLACVVYLILFPAGFSDIHPGYDKTAFGLMCSAEKINIIFDIPQ